MAASARAALSALVLLSAGGAASAAPRAPDLSRIPGDPAPPHGTIYADCIVQAATTGAFDRTSAGKTNLLRFHCSGPPARAFYEALADWSAARRSEWTADGRTWRSTNRIVRSLFGADYCSSDGASDYTCDVTLNVGDFLAG